MNKKISIAVISILLSSCSFNYNNSLNHSSSNNVSTSSNVSSFISTNSDNSSTNNIVESIEQELLRNNDFNSLDNWIIFNETYQKLNVISHGNNVLELNVNNKGAINNWSNQVLQNGLILETENSYKVSFEIESSINRDIQFLIQQDSNYNPTPLNKTYSLNANKKILVEEEVFISYTSSYLYGFMLGNINGTFDNDHTIKISNVSLFGKKNKNSSSNELDGSNDEIIKEKYNKKLVWSDEFNGNKLDTSMWNYEIGTGSWGWGNNEKQYYTNSENNCYVSNGSLKIKAIKENYGDCDYTSARINTKGKYEVKYGYIEARMALPSMSGIWPAFWMLGANIDSKTWPYCGEIDIMEAINFNNHIYSTLHWNQGNSYSHKYMGTSAVDVGDRTEYHKYGLLWDENEMRFYHDDELHYVFNLNVDSSLEVFRKDFYFLLNVAVGGNWPGFNIGNDFPMIMCVDYLRVYQ